MMAKKKSEIICALCGKVIIGKDQTQNQERIIVGLLMIHVTLSTAMIAC